MANVKEKNTKKTTTRKTKPVKKEKTTKKKTTRVKKTKEVKANLSDVRTELVEYIDLKVENSVKKEIENNYKKTIRRKNRNIIIKNIIIIFLLLLIAYLLFVVYKKNHEYYKPATEIEVLSREEMNNNSLIDTNEELISEDELSKNINEYGHLVYDILVNEDSVYLEDFYDGKITSDIRNYISFSHLNFDEINDDGYGYVLSDSLPTIHNLLFNANYEEGDFNYLDNNVRFIDKIDAYITDDKLIDISSNINKVITDVNVKDDVVEITTVEGLIDDGRLCNIITKDVIDLY